MKLILLFFFISIGQITLACEDCYRWTSLKTSKYEISYPSSWILNEEGDGGTSFILFSELEDKNDSFKENVFLITQDFSKYNLNLNQYVTSIVKQIELSVKDFKLISSVKLESNGKELQKLIYSGRQGNFQIQFVQCFWVHSKDIYVLSIVSEQSKLDKYKFKMDKILESFYLK